MNGRLDNMDDVTAEINERNAEKAVTAEAGLKNINKLRELKYKAVWDRLQERRLCSDFDAGTVCRYENDLYSVTVFPKLGVFEVSVSSGFLGVFPVRSVLNDIEKRDTGEVLTEVEVRKSAAGAWVCELSAYSDLWRLKKYQLVCGRDSVMYRCSVYRGSDGFVRLDQAEYFSPGMSSLSAASGAGSAGAFEASEDFRDLDFTSEVSLSEHISYGTACDRLYVPRFDWSRGKVHVQPDASDSLSCQQWLSPPPFYYGMEKNGLWYGTGIAAEQGKMNFISFDYNGVVHVEDGMKNRAAATSSKGIFSLMYEGHTKIDRIFQLPDLLFLLHGSVEENIGLSRYADFVRNWSHSDGELAVLQGTPETADGVCLHPGVDGREVHSDSALDNGAGSRADSRAGSGAGSGAGSSAGSSASRVSVPIWWKEPIFCGWGQQRLDYRRDHDGAENGNWINAGDYATELFYRKYIDHLESHGVNPGIIIIDCFWAARPLFAEPHPLKWHNMRAFIDEQHQKGRHVLLWLTPIIAEGLPREACMTLGDEVIAADPTSYVYQDILEAEITSMISGDNGCLNADGFKIDFTQNIPAERGVFRNNLLNRWAIISENLSKCYTSIDKRSSLIQTAQPKWGLELIKSYIEAVRRPMKRAKADSLLITHTANPAMAEYVDMLRLNDMDGSSPDVLGIMSNRAAIAKACCPDWLIDTDNDLMLNKEMWRKYITLQAQLGNPDTYYASGIASSGEDFDEEDYRLLRDIWAEYRSGL